MKLNLLLILSLFTLLGTSALSQDYFRFIEPSSGRALNVENGPVQLGPVQPGWFSAMWEMSNTDQNKFLIRNRHTGQYLIVNQGRVSTTKVPPSPQGTGDHFWTRDKGASADPDQSYLRHSSGLYLTPSRRVGLVMSNRPTPWDFNPVGPPAQAKQPIEYVRLQIASQPSSYLNVEQGGLESGSIQPGWVSARWEIKQTGGQGMQVAFRNIYTGDFLIANGDSVTTGRATANPQGGGTHLWRVISNSQDPSKKALYHVDSGRPLCGGKGLRLGTLNQDAPLLLKFEYPSKPTAAPPAKSYFRISSVAAPGLKVNNEGGALQCTQAQPGWFSAMWEVEEQRDRGRILAFRNRWTGDYLLMQGSSLATGSAQVSRDGRGPHLWQAVGSDSNPRQISLRNLSTGAYLRYFTKLQKLGVDNSNAGTETLWTVEGV